MIKKVNWYAIIIFLPVIIIYGIFIIGGLVLVIIESTGHIPGLGISYEGLKHYRELFLKESFVQSILYSLYIAFTSALIATTAGVLAAYSLTFAKSKFWSYVSRKILEMGMILPYLYIVFLALILFSRTGLFSRILFSAGIIDSLESFPAIFYNKSGAGIILVFIIKGFAFVSIFTFNIMARIGPGFEQISRTLGGGYYFTLKKVYLPLCSNVIIWCYCIVFIYFLGSFEVPYLLGGGEFVTLSSMLYSLYINPDIKIIPQAMALNVILYVLGIIWVFISGMLFGRYFRRRAE